MRFRNSLPCPLQNGAWSVAVVIPARNESATIGACLFSVLESIDKADRTIGNWVVVVADSCTDDTADIARVVLGPRGEVVECAAESAGAARRSGVAAALQQFAGLDHQRLWVANTDADTCVPDDWIKRHLEMAEAGYAGVAGIVHVESVPGCDTTTLRHLFEDYIVLSDGTHPHVHGANLGVRADAYLDVGGWSQIKLAEDHCLWNRLRRRGWCVASVAASVVSTSGRPFGRAVGGFADSILARLQRRTT
jgi:cellulose synthase/poly-beta-1,6-N-acetylglucosamine synthase-like glycosyltransferase